MNAAITADMTDLPNPLFEGGLAGATRSVVAEKKGSSQAIGGSRGGRTDKPASCPASALRPGCRHRGGARCSNVRAAPMSGLLADKGCDGDDLHGETDLL